MESKSELLGEFVVVFYISTANPKLVWRRN